MSARIAPAGKALAAGSEGRGIVCRQLLSSLFWLFFSIVVFGVRNFAKHMATGCCGGGDTPRRNRVKDRNRGHYPYAATLAIDGMSCRNCAVHVENALNGLDGVWAKVNLDAKKATVLMKSELGDAQLASPVAAAGYTVRGIQRP